MVWKGKSKPKHLIKNHRRVQITPVPQKLVQELVSETGPAGEMQASSEVHQELVCWGKVVAASLVTPHYRGNPRVHKIVIKSVNQEDKIITEQSQRNQ